MTLAIAAPAARGPRAHPLGFCTCESHVDRPWDRSEHWKADEVSYLEANYGRRTDEAIAAHLGRPVLGIRLKAKRLGLRKRAWAFTGGQVAEIFGVDPTVVGKRWIRKGLLKATRSAFRQGVNRVLFVQPDDVDRFIHEHPQYIDIDKMPDSPWKELALAGGRWHSLPDVQRLTGRNSHILSKECLEGRWPARKRGAHWMIHESQIAAITATAGHNGRYASMDARERRLELRRNVRKGVETPRPHPLLGAGRPSAVWWKVVDCADCGGSGRIRRRLTQPTARQRVVAYTIRQLGSVAAAAELLKSPPRAVTRARDEYARRVAVLRRPTMPCGTCVGKGKVMRNRDELRILPAEWAA